MSQNNQRKHYHIHAPYQHPHQQQQQQQHHHQQQLQHHHQQQQHPHHQQWYSQPHSQQHYQQHGLHLRDSRHMTHATAHGHHHQQQQHHTTQHGHHHQQQQQAHHMYASGYAGMATSASATASSVASGGSGVSAHSSAAISSSHNMPVAASSSSSSSSAVHHHYSATALAASSASSSNAGVSAGGGVAGVSSAYAAASRNRMFDLEMLTPQQQHTQHSTSHTPHHSMLTSSTATSGRPGFDAYSHSSLYAQQSQRQHSTASSSHHPNSHHTHPHHLAATHHSLHPHHSSHHTPSAAAALTSQHSSHSQHHHPQHHQQHYYHHTAQSSLHRPHTQVMGPMLQHIKSEPVEQITITPSIQTEEVIIKSEPVDESSGGGYHKSAPQIENNSFHHMEEKRKQHELQQKQQQQQKQLQHQQQLQQQQRVQHQQLQERQQQLHQHQLQQQQQQQQRQQQQIQIKQEPHDYPTQHHHQTHSHHHHQQQQQQQREKQQPQQHQQSQHTHNEDISQQSHEQQQQKQQNKRINSENSTTLQQKQQEQQPQQPAAATTTTLLIPKQEPQEQQQQPEQQQQQISLTNIKTEAKPLNFPRRKLQTERSSTLPICQRCKQVFLKRQNYAQHVALSSCNIVEYDFKCSVCPMSFMSNEELQTHEQLHRSHRYFCQKYCGKFYETIEECEQHEYRQHEYEMYKCNICCISVTERDQLFMHLQDHKYQPRFDCCICRLCFQTSLDLHDHYITNEDFCGKFYDKEAFKKPNTSLTTPYLGKPESSHLEISNTFSLKDIPPANSRHLEPLYTKPTTSTTSKSNMEPPNTPTTTRSSSTFSLEPADFSSLEPQVEVKTEIKVEPDFYPPMDQSDYGFNDQEYHTNDYNTESQQNLSFLQDFHDNASNSTTNSSFSYHNNNDAIQDDDAMCCVPKCGVSKYSAPSLQFFGFPRDEKYLSQWLHNLKMVYDPNVNYGAYRICSLHFPKRCIAKYSLSYWAVPTFNLGHDDVGNLYQNRESSGGFPAGEMAKCSMPGCPSQRGETNVKFHVFPRDLKTLIKWCQNSRLPVHSKDNRFFCSRHFEEKCFGKFRLKPWAIPTLNLGTVYGKIHDNPNIYQEEKKCFLPFCRRSRSYDCNLSLYRFPRDETLLRRWCYNLRLDPNMYRGKNHKICSSHFIKEALGLRKLNPGAVPTLNLGHNDRFNIYENELYTPPPPPPPPPQPSTSKAHKFERLFKQEMGSSSHIYDNVFMNSMVQKYSSSSSSNSGNNLDLGDVCLVPTCKRTRHTADITLHTVPKRPEQLKKWCHNLKLDLTKMHKSVRICSAHFEKYCIGGCMRPFAVPTLELGHDDTNIYRNPDVIKKLNIRETCCVQSCKRNRDRDHANLHRFPTHPELLQKWCENLQKPIPDGTKLFNDAVCEIHFEDRCLRNKRLEKWAIPTLNLGWDEAPHSLPSEEEINENWVKPFAPNNGDEQGECCVASCKRNPQIDDIKLYRPPEDAEQLVKWAHNLQVDVSELPNLKICNLHFEQHCIGKRLLNWAMPTLNLGGKVEHLFENPPPMPTVYKKKVKPERILSNQEAIKWSPRCCLPHCRKMRSVDKVHLFRFPYSNRQTLAKWCHNLQLPLVGSSHRRICSSHFESSVLTKRCPMSLAVPTLDLNAPPGYKIYQNPARLKQIKPGAQRQCIIESCRKTKLDGVTLYRFPNNRSILYKWRHNIKNWPKGKLTSLMRICGEHFEPHSVSERKLSPGAIPTLNLGHDSKDLYPNETRSYFDLEKCVVNGCDSRKEMEDIRLFRFPRDDEELLKKWCHNLQMNPNDCMGIKICSKHFEEECLGPRQLYKWSIPTLKLGHKEDELVDIIPNPPPEQRTGEFLFKCCVPGCGKTRKYDDAQMNSFPKHLKLFRKWKHNLKLDFLNFKEREKYKICNDHFEPICVGKTRLNFGALPTLNLGHDDVDDLYQINPERIRPNLFIKHRDAERLERRRILRSEQSEQYEECEEANQPQEEAADPLSLEPTDVKCCVGECSAPKSIMREPYDLPDSKKFKQMWLKELAENDDEDIEDFTLLDNKICGLHFQMVFNKLKDKMQQLSEENEELLTDFNKLLYNYQKSNISLVVNSYQCRVLECSSNLLNSNIRLYFFPYGKNLVAKWSHNTGIIPDEHRRYMNKVCNLHFESYCITENQRLRSWAIPTLNLPQQEENKTIYKNPDLTKLDKRMLGPQIFKCAVKNCNSSKSDETESIKLFNFPSDDNLLQKWCDNLKMSHHYTPLLKICSLHFEKLCFGSTRIRSWAIPTLNLGHDEQPEHVNKSVVSKEVIEETPVETEEVQLKQVKIKRVLDSAKCFVASCRKSRLKHGVRFYSLPSNPRLKRKWLHNLQIKNLKSLSKMQNIKICNLHFHKRCLDGKQLKPWAVPTLHLGHSDNIQDNRRRRQNLPLLRCALKHCKNHENLKGTRAFVFPKSLEFLEKWSKNLKLDLEKCKGRICREHFEPEVIGDRKLKSGAVPTLNLGHNDPDIYDNSELKDKNVPQKIEEVKITSDNDIEYEAHSEEEEEEEEELWETDVEDEEEQEEEQEQVYYDDDEEEEEEDEEVEVDAEEQEQEEDYTKDNVEERSVEDDSTSISYSITDWGSIKFKELRVSITPLTPEDLMDLCSRSSYEKEFGALTPASSLKGRRSVTPASSCKDLRAITPEQKSNVFNFNLKTNNETQEQKTPNKFREPRSVTPDQRMETKTPDSNSKLTTAENNLKRPALDTNNEDNKRERLDLNEDDTSSTSLPNDTETNLRTDKALNAVAPICCLKHCGKEKTPEQHLSTFGFPKDPQLLQKWCDNLGLQPEECIGRVCIDHFELRVIGSRRLKQGAVPTLNLGPNRTAKHTNIEEPAQKKTPTKDQTESNNITETDGHLKPPPPYKTPKPSKQSVFRLCCLKHCRRKKFVKPEKREKQQQEEVGSKELLFKFPKDERVLKKWFKNLRLPENLKLTQELEICSRHFETKVIRQDKLHPLAVPTLELSYANRKPIYKNNFKIKDEEVENENKEDNKEEKNKCFLKHCGKKENNDIFLISFPQQDIITLRKWCKNLKLNYETKTYENLKICNDHFEPYVFYKKRHLRVGAIPTLNLGHTDVIIRNCRRLRLKRSNSFKDKEKCSVAQCQETNLKLYSFPRSSELRKIWCNNLQLELRQVLNSHLKICAQHFSPESFIIGTDNLKHNAIPVKNLGLQTEQHILKNSLEEESKCLVENCQKTPSVDRVKLFKFPEKPDILKKWLFNLNLSPETFSGQELICSKHFDKTCIKNGQLHENAIPTQFLELYEKSWFYNNNEDLYELNKKCCVLECQQSSEQAKHLYRFPKHKEDVDKWLYNLKLPVEETDVKDLRVCDRHFEQSCKISNKDLITQALPTLNLGHNDTDIYGNNFIKCCLDSCNIEGFYYHKLPEDLMLQSFWFQELEIESSFNSSLYICSVHFVAFFERILEKYSVFLKESKEYVKLSLTYNELKTLPALQTYKCHIPKCNSGFKLIWKLFKFPKDRNLFNKWLHNTGLQFDYDQRPNYRLCAQHFEERCLSEKKLHRWSLPTLNLPFNNSLYVNPPEALPPQHENLKHCCVSNCLNEKGPFYKFPAKQLDIKKWIHNLDLGPQQCTLNLRVCYKHFENYCFAKAKERIKPLKSWSVPTLKLKRKSDLYLNPMDKINFYVCCLNSCKQMLNKSKDIYLFKFPLSTSLKQKWLHNLNMSKENYKDTMRLCSLHFEMDCFNKGYQRLRKRSVPTLALSNPPKDLYCNPIRRPYLKCCIKLCKAPGEQLLGFPKQKTLLRKWCHNLQLDKAIKLETLRDWKICSVHFEEQCFNKLKNLRNLAVPTLKLGHRKKLFKNPDFKRKSAKLKEVESIRDELKDDTNANQDLPDSNKEQSLVNANEKPVNKKQVSRKSLKEEQETKLSQEDDVKRNNEKVAKNKKSLNEKQEQTLIERNAGEMQSGLKDIKPNKRSRSAVAKLQHQYTTKDKDQDESLTLKQLVTKAKNLRSQSAGRKPKESKDNSENSFSIKTETKINKVKNLKTKTKGKTQADNENKIEEIKTKLNKEENLENRDEICLNSLESTEKEKETVEERKSKTKITLRRPIRTVRKPLKCLKKTVLKRKYCKKQTTKESFESQENTNTEELNVEAIKIEQPKENLNLSIKENMNWENKVKEKGIGLDEDSSIKPVINIKETSPDNAENLLQIIREAEDITEDQLGNDQSQQTTTFTIYEIKQEVSDEENNNTENNNEQSDSKNNEEDDQLDLKLEENEEKSSKYRILVACCIKTCPNFNNAETKVPLFKIPGIQKLRNHWLENCKLDHKQYSAKGNLYKLKVCLEHFEKKCFIGKQRMLFGAVPTLKLGRKLSFKPSLDSYRSQRCKINSCQRSVHYDSIRHVAFPQKLELKRRWCWRLKMREEDIKQDDWICHRHFERKSFIDGIKLREGILPSLLLNKQDEFAEETGELKKCCVSACGENFQPPLFQFPQQSMVIYKKWLQQLKLKNSNYIKEKCFVCSKHFKENCFYPSNNKRLKWRAIPELYLDQQEGEEEISKENKEETETEKVATQQEDLDEDHLHIDKENKCWEPFCKAKTGNLYEWPYQQIFGKLWLDSIKYFNNKNKKQYKILVLKSKMESIKLCSEHFYILYKNHEKTLEINDFKDPQLKSLHENTLATFKHLNSLCKIYTRKCCVSNCKTDHNLKIYKYVKLFPFPNSELAQKWCHNLQLDFVYYQQHPQLKVCELHFVGYCLYRRVLWHWAIPTLNLTLDSEHIIQNDAEDFFSFTGCCCIPICANSRGLVVNTKTRFYQFPQQNDLLQKWLEATNCREFKKNSTRICGLHFRKEDIDDKLKLRENAIPCYNLGGAEVREESVAFSGGIDENIQVKQELDLTEEWDDENFKGFENEQEQDTKELNMDLQTLDENIQIKEELVITEEWPESEELDNQNPNSFAFGESENVLTKLNIKQEFPELTDNEFSPTCSKRIKYSTDFQNISNTPSPNFIITDIQSQIYLCCVQKCPHNSQTSGIQMITEFPRDSEIFIKWCFNLKIDPRVYKENQYAICNKHFESICFTDDQNLYPWAVPTLHLNLNENSFIHQNDIPEHMKPASEQCLVYGCINPLKPLYKFPLKADLARKWFANLKLDYTDSRAQNYRICKRHFPPTIFELNDTNKLKTEAVPTLFLGHNDKILYFNNPEDQQQLQLQELQMEDIMVVGNQDNSRGSSQGSLLNRIISPNDLEDHDSSYFEDFEEYYGQDE